MISAEADQTDLDLAVNILSNREVQAAEDEDEDEEDEAKYEQGEEEEAELRWRELEGIPDICHACAAPTGTFHRGTRHVLWLRTCARAWPGCDATGVLLTDCHLSALSDSRVRHVWAARLLQRRMPREAQKGEGLTSRMNPFHLLTERSLRLVLVPDPSTIRYACFHCLLPILPMSPTRVLTPIPAPRTMRSPANPYPRSRRRMSPRWWREDSLPRPRKRRNPWSARRCTAR